MAKSISDNGSNSVFKILRRKARYLDTVNAMQELAELGKRWHEAESRTKIEQEMMLNRIRRLLLEVETGYTDDLPARFREAEELVAHIFNRSGRKHSGRDSEEKERGGGKK